MCGLPNWVEVAVERAAGPSYRVTLQGRALDYATWRDDGAPVTLRVHPTPQDWRDFLTALEAVGLWQWAPEYTNPAPAAGIRWYIELAAPGRQINTAGTDAYPPADAFPRFCAAVQALLGGREFA